MKSLSTKEPIKTYNHLNKYQATTFSATIFESLYGGTVTVLSSCLIFLASNLLSYCSLISNCDATHWSNIAYFQCNT